MLQGLPKQDHTYAAYSDNHVEFLFTPPHKTPDKLHGAERNRPI